MRFGHRMGRVPYAYGVQALNNQPLHTVLKHIPNGARPHPLERGKSRIKTTRRKVSGIKPNTRCYHGAPGPIRTADTRFRRAVLCPLSYGGVSGIVANPQPARR